jgi:hypothetical protein
LQPDGSRGYARRSSRLAILEGWKAITSLSVVGAGFGRTGMPSLRLALERLDFGPRYHIYEVFAHPEHIPF